MIEMGKFIDKLNYTASKLFCRFSDLDRIR